MNFGNVMPNYSIPAFCTHKGFQPFLYRFYSVPSSAALKSFISLLLLLKMSLMDSSLDGKSVYVMKIQIQVKIHSCSNFYAFSFPLSFLKMIWDLQKYLALAVSTICVTSLFLITHFMANIAIFPVKPSF